MQLQKVNRIRVECALQRCDHRKEKVIAPVFSFHLLSLTKGKRKPKFTFNFNANVTHNNHILF